MLVFFWKPFERVKLTVHFLVLTCIEMVFQRLSFTFYNPMQNPAWFGLRYLRGGMVLLAFWVLCLQAFATHNRAGEITYSHVEGLTYEILITTYTKSSAPADRP